LGCTSLVDATEMFGNIALSIANYDSLLIGWGSQNLKKNVNFSGRNSNYWNVESAKTRMINNCPWNIGDGGKDGAIIVIMME